MGRRTAEAIFSGRIPAWAFEVPILSSMKKLDTDQIGMDIDEEHPWRDVYTNTVIPAG